MSTIVSDSPYSKTKIRIEGDAETEYLSLVTELKKLEEKLLAKDELIRRQDEEIKFLRSQLATK